MASTRGHPSPSTRSVSTAPTNRASKKILTRNIDEVVLGNIAFPTWYYSPYPDDMILHADDRTSRQSSSHADLTNGISSSTETSHVTSNTKVCPRLHVCPYCFKYTPLVDKYVLHLQHHQHLEESDPATPPVPSSASKVYEHSGYAVWEVDGEHEKLYCQNLSLFGKLFLEQKSVFYDTGGFLYFVLTYTPPPPPNNTITTPAKPKRGRRPAAASNPTHSNYGLNTHVLGFFSKENPSWDSNNLACILVFPPHQHRQLGKLLMSISYKLSAWEWDVGIIGGPEKPLSEMGRKSYLRFWSERIARFAIGESPDAERRRVFEKKRKRKGKTNTVLRKEEMSVQEIGKRTGMLSEDVVAALTEMGVCETVTPKKKQQRLSNGTDHIPDEETVVTMAVKRSAILVWAERNAVKLEDPVQEDGFLGEWAATDDGELVMEEEVADEEDE